MNEMTSEHAAAEMPRFFRGERLLPYASLIGNPMPVFVNRVQESFELRMHAHDFIEICLVAEGAGVHYIDAAQMPVARGDLFFIPVGIAHVFRPAAKGRPLALYNCILTAEQLVRLLQAVQAEAEIADFYRELGTVRAWFHMHDRGEAGTAALSAAAPRIHFAKDRIHGRVVRADGGTADLTVPTTRRAAAAAGMRLPPNPSPLRCKSCSPTSKPIAPRSCMRPTWRRGSASATGSSSGLQEATGMTFLGLSCRAPASTSAAGCCWRRRTPSATSRPLRLSGQEVFQPAVQTENRRHAEPIPRLLAFPAA